MSNRWRERKGGTFVSASELAARKKELLAPVQKWRKVWVQPSNSGISNYRVLKWVAKSSSACHAGEYDDPLALDASDSEHHAPSSPSSDDDDDEDDNGDGDDSKSKAKLDRKTTKAEEDGQLAGLETGETAEDVMRITGSSLLARGGSRADSISGTATPADREDSIPHASLSALGGLDGGAASKLSTNRPQPKPALPPSLVISRGDTPMDLDPSPIPTAHDIPPPAQPSPSPIPEQKIVVSTTDASPVVSAVAANSPSPTSQNAIQTSPIQTSKDSNVQTSSPNTKPDTGEALNTRAVIVTVAETEGGGEVANDRMARLDEPKTVEAETAKAEMPEVETEPNPVS